jgi:hypothetical protein
MDYFQFISEDFGCLLVLIKSPKFSDINRKKINLEKFRVVSTKKEKNFFLNKC